MTGQGLRVCGCIALVITAILLFVAWERYEDNAEKVRAMNEMGFQELMGGANLQAAVPTATIYALLFAGLAAVGGIICFVLAAREGGP